MNDHLVHRPVLAVAPLTIENCIDEARMVVIPLLGPRDTLAEKPPGLAWNWLWGFSDGDTLNARCGEPSGYNQIKVRLSGIGAPESCHWPLEICGRSPGDGAMELALSATRPLPQGVTHVASQIPGCGFVSGGVGSGMTGGLPGNGFCGLSMWLG